MNVNLCMWKIRQPTRMVKVKVCLHDMPNILLRLAQICDLIHSCFFKAS